jgi:tRNA dimethylallyltransferase
MDNNKIIIIGGPTASYKSELALKLASGLNGAIINADSMQIYKELPIISAQPNSSEKEIVEHYLYSHIDAGQNYSVAEWLDECINIINMLHLQQKTPIIVGGTGLYIHALVNGLALIPTITKATKDYCQEELKTHGYEGVYKFLAKVDAQILKKIHHHDKQRTLRAFEVYIETKLSIFEHHKNTKPFFKEEQFNYIVSDLNREDLYARCDKRIKLMIENGAIEEVKNFINLHLDHKLSIFNTIGVKSLLNFFQESLSFDEAISFWQQETRNFAKRQTTWFKNQLNHLNKKSYTTYAELNEISENTIKFN